MRAIAGNGSLRLSGILYQPLIYKIKGEPEDMVDPSEPPLSKKVTLQSFVGPLRLLLDRSIFLNLVFGGVVYAIWSMVTSSTTGLFKGIFGLDELRLGLAFLPNGRFSHRPFLFSGRITTRPDANIIDPVVQVSAQ